MAKRFMRKTINNATFLKIFKIFFIWLDDLAIEPFKASSMGLYLDDGRDRCSLVSLLTRHDCDAQLLEVPDSVGILADEGVRLVHGEADALEAGRRLQGGGVQLIGHGDVHEVQVHGDLDFPVLRELGCGGAECRVALRVVKRGLLLLLHFLVYDLLQFLWERVAVIKPCGKLQYNLWLEFVIPIVRKNIEN